MAVNLLRIAYDGTMVPNVELWSYGTKYEPAREVTSVDLERERLL